MSLEELTGGRVRQLGNNATRVFAFGGHGHIQGSSFCKAFSRRLMVLRPSECSFLFDGQVCADKILDSLDALGSRAGVGDTSVVYYFGHGMPDYFVLPSGVRLDKDVFFHYVGGISGRKVVIVSACHSDFLQIPDNTLLVASSAIDTSGIIAALEMAISYDMKNTVGRSRRPLDSMVACLLQQYHNRPLVRLDADKLYPNELRGPFSSYQEERYCGRPILSGYQRVMVRSTLVEAGVRLGVDSLCNFV